MHNPDELSRLAWAGKIIAELARLVDLPVSDEHHSAEVLPRADVMDAIRKIKESAHEGEAVIRALAAQSATAADNPPEAGVTRKPGFMCIDSGRVVEVERHDWPNISGFQNVWITAAAEPAPQPKDAT